MSEPIQVVAAAIKLGSGKVVSLPSPARHCDVIQEVIKTDPDDFSWDGQGFLLSNGQWADRVAAAGVALVSGQIKMLRWPPRLYSEDLW